MRREQRRRERASLRRTHITISHSIAIAALTGVCTFCILLEPECWPLAVAVFAAYLLKSELFGELRNMLRWGNHQERVLHRNRPSVLQTIYRGFPPTPVYIPTEIPQHVLERSQPDHPTEPEQKARRLLWSLLNPNQRLQYIKTNKFIVDLPLSYSRLLTPYAILGDGYVHWPDGQRQCVHPRSGGKFLPITDSVIAQLIHLRNDPGVLHRLR